jgi:spermidine synthase
VRKVRDAHTRDLGLRPGLAALLLGFLAAAFQIYLLREFSAEFTGNELTFGLVLGAWLLWGGIGSLVRPRQRAAPPGSGLARLYGVTVALFCGSLVLLRFSHKLLGILPAEATGLVPALGFALVIGLLLSFPLGHAFVLNAGILGDDVGLVYILESAGAASAGLIVHFLLIPRLSNWQGAAVVGGAAAVLALIALRPSRSKAILAAAFFLAAGLGLSDRTALKAAWKPLDLADAEDTLYGKLLVVRSAEQVTLFDNGLAVFSRPDIGASEDAVHFAMLQRDDVDRVLLVGGTASGCLEEVLKYPGVAVDCVELDPAVVRLARRHLPPPALAALDDPRVHIFSQDGRAFLERTTGPYDAVLLNLPDPGTAQINRYYTREFFAGVRKKLEPGGILSFVLTGGENYISVSLARYLASIVSTLRDVFPGQIAAIPGTSVVVLASDGRLSVDPEFLAARIGRLGLETTYVSPAMLPFRLDPERVDRLNTALALAGTEGRINRDLVPVSYFFQSMLWAGQFGGLEARLLEASARIPRALILDAPLVLIALALSFLARRLRRSASRFLVPVAIMGVTSIVVEVAVFIAFQASFGVVYGKIPLLLAAFMAGLVAGALLGRRRKRPGRADLPIVQGGFVLLLAATLGVLPGRGGEAVPFALLAGFGALSGYLFITANRLLLREIPHVGLGYGVDLIASFAGAVLASALLIPLFGIPALILRLAVLNVLALAFVLATPSR